MLPSDQPIVCILIRDKNDKWQLTYSVNLQGDESVFLLPTTKGQIMIVGNFGEEDYSKIKTILKENISNANGVYPEF